MRFADLKMLMIMFSFVGQRGGEAFGPSDVDDSPKWPRSKAIERLLGWI